jgi:L-fuculose-phosphate aldolase
MYKKIDDSKYFMERKTVAEFMKRLYDRKLTTASGGNISLRLNEEMFCITPSAIDKGNLHPEQIAVVTFQGENLTPDIPLSIETEMHRAVLLQRPDRNAVVHAHPVFASAFATAQPCGIDTHLSAEAYYMIGDVVNVPYELMGTKSLAMAVKQYIEGSEAILMENHGALTVGKDILRAFECMDLLERIALMTLAVKNIPHSNDLSAKKLAEINTLR